MVFVWNRLKGEGRRGLFELKLGVEGFRREAEIRGMMPCITEIRKLVSHLMMFHKDL